MWVFPGTKLAFKDACGHKTYHAVTYQEQTCGGRSEFGSLAWMPPFAPNLYTPPERWPLTWHLLKAIVYLSLTVHPHCTKRVSEEPVEALCGFVHLSRWVRSGVSVNARPPVTLRILTHPSAPGETQPDPLGLPEGTNTTYCVNGEKTG